MPKANPHTARRRASNNQVSQRGQWVRIASAFAGYYYVPGLMARMRRKWPCDHSAGGWQFEGDLLCRKCGAVIDWFDPPRTALNKSDKNSHSGIDAA